PPDRPRAPAPASRRGLRTAIAVLVLAVVVVIGSAIGYVYVRSQYFVGLQEGNVAIFRGVHGSVAGVSLNSVQDRTSLSSARLSEVERDRLEDGIVAKDERDARDIVARLFVTSGCAPKPKPTPTPAASTKPTAAASATPSPAPSAPSAAPCT
ncbi:MAG: protein serine/threonine phosphatase, partial [Frankiales bacterium]|nr:protein serine/threonine phosphatase [Frankiales bacterium]